MPAAHSGALQTERATLERGRPSGLHARRCRAATITSSQPTLQRRGGVGGGVASPCSVTLSIRLPVIARHHATWRARHPAAKTTPRQEWNPRALGCAAAGATPHFNSTRCETGVEGADTGTITLTDRGWFGGKERCVLGGVGLGAAY